MAALCATACSKRTRRTPDDTIVVVIEAVIRDIDPRFAVTNHDVKLSRLVAPGLTSIDQQSTEPRLELAASIDQVDDTTWDVTLREGLLFSDGSKVTAYDVEYTFESAMDPDTNSLYRRGFDERFKSLEVLDELRVRFHLQKPVATLLTDLDFGIVSKKASERKLDKFDHRTVIGAGPYRVVSKATELVELARNPYYWGKAALVEKIQIRTVRDANARTLMLVGGSADFTQNSIRVDLVDEVAKRDRIELVAGPSAILTYLMMQNDDPILKDVRVRRAIAHAVDRERIVSAKFHGRAVLATGLLPPSHWAYTGEVDRYEHSLQRARELLDEAGYPDPDGPGGKPRMKLTYKTSADQFRVAIARIIASQLAEIGIDVEVRSFEFGTFFVDIKKGNFQLASMQTASITEPDYYYAYFHSKRIPSEQDPDSGNRWRYRNPELDALTEKGREVSDRQQRMEIYRDVQRILARDIPIIPLWHEDNVALLNRDIVGYTVLPNARLAGLVQAKKLTK